MAINFDNALSIHSQALILREKRSELLASNLANADTPGFKAKDLDFQSVFKQTLSNTVALDKTQAGHMASTAELSGGTTLKYRVPNQAALDGNSVEVQVEQAKYAENNVQYQASLQFLKGEFSGILTAIRGQ